MAAEFSQVGLLAHGAAAVGFAGLAGMLLWRREQTIPSLWLVAAAAASALWNFVSFFALRFGAPYSNWVSLTETARTALWYLFLVALLFRSWRLSRAISHSLVWAVALGFIFALQFITDLSLLFGVITGPGAAYPLLGLAFLLGRLACAIGGLVLAHNLYVNAAPMHRWSIRLLCIGLGGLFAYDTNLYTVMLLSGRPSLTLLDARGLVNLLIVPLIFASAQRNRLWKLDIQISRQVVFQSLSLVGVGAYLIVMSVAAYGLRLVGGSWGSLLQISFLFGTLIAAMVILMSGRFRAWAKVKINKHFFAYKYDYREEWLRFIATLSGARATDASLHARVIQAVCDIVDAPAGALWLPDEEGAFSLASRWNTRAAYSGVERPDGPFIQFLSGRQRIVNFDELRAGLGDYDGLVAPAWAEPSLWLGIPMIHADRMAGLLLIEQPRAPRELNWEDFDLLRTVGRQAASYLAEQASEAALMDARKFEEFNRRFAFIMHDIKNLVSQLSLVARNAERHADNPDFQRDMMLTIRDSVDKMNDLLVRLKQHSTARSDAVSVDLCRLLERLVAERSRTRDHLNFLRDDRPAIILAHDGRLEQVFGHLIQNAVDASAPDTPIQIRLFSDANNVEVQVEDHGVGMTAEFIRNDLFTPFRSTKTGGFGIGAYEAREIVKGYGGRIEVRSRVGEGTVFTVSFPNPEPGAQPLGQRAARETMEGAAAHV